MMRDHTPDHPSVTVPEGYMQNAKGALVPVGTIRPRDLKEDELVREIAARADAVNAVLAQFKAWGFSQVEGFRERVASDYDVQLGGPKGNLTLTSFDGSLQVQVSVSDNLTFGPELEAAKALIDNCVRRWSEGANDNIRALVDHAFQVNKQGRIDTARVLGLRRIEMGDDQEWSRAMDAISDAIRISGTRTYLRVYRRDPQTGAKTAIALDLAGV